MKVTEARTEPVVVRTEAEDGRWKLQGLAIRDLHG